MPDPLTTVADEFAPAPLNIFDPKLAESVISRHGNAKRGLQTSSLLAKTVSDAANAEAAKRREERDALLATREDLEYAEKKEAEAMRGDIIAGMYEDLRPNEPGFDERATAFLSKAAPSIIKDPVFNEVMRGLSRRADIADEERRKTDEINLRQKNTVAAIREREKYDDTMKFLTEEDIANLPKDEMGNPDMFSAGMLAGQRKREAGIEDFGKKAEIKKNATIDILNTKNMDAQQRALYDETEDILIESPEAFPRRTDIILQKAKADGKTANPTTLIADPKWGQELLKAQEWDKNIFKNEVLSAKKAKTPEEYINFTDIDGKPAKLTPTAEEYRRRVWEYAHQNDDAAPAQTAPAPTTAAPTTAVPPADTPIDKKFPEGSRKVKLPNGEYRIVTPDKRVLLP